MISYRKVASKIFDWFEIDRFRNEAFFEVINLAKWFIMRCDLFLKWSLSKWPIFEVTIMRRDSFSYWSISKGLVFRSDLLAKWLILKLIDVEMIFLSDRNQKDTIYCRKNPPKMCSYCFKVVFLGMIKNLYFQKSTYSEVKGSKVYHFKFIGFDLKNPKFPEIQNKISHPLQKR